MRAPTVTFGRKSTIAPSMMFLRFKAKSQRRSPINFRPGSRPQKRMRSSNVRLTTFLPSNSTAGRTISSSTRASARRQGHVGKGGPSFQRAAECDPPSGCTLQQLALSYEIGRRYADSVGVVRRALLMRPDDTETAAGFGLLFVEWKADTQRLRQAVD